MEQWIEQIPLWIRVVVALAFGLFTFLTILKVSRQDSED